MSTDPRPLYLFGRRQLDGLGQRIQRALPELAERWWQQCGRMQLAGVSMWNDELRSSSVRYVLRGAEDRWLAFLGTQQAWLKLAEGWLGCDVPAEGPLIGALQREFCLALYRALVGADAVAVVLEHAGWSDIPATTLKPGGGALVVELDVDGVPITLVAPIALWPDLATWPTQQPASAKHQVGSALAQSRLHLDVRLPAVRIAMTDMSALAVGDFLDLEHDLSGRVRVLAAGTDVNLPAMVGKHDGHKAVRIESINTADKR